MEELKDSIYFQRMLHTEEDSGSSTDLIELELEQQILMEEDLALQLDMLNNMRDETTEAWMNDDSILDSSDDALANEMEILKNESRVAAAFTEMIPVFLVSLFFVSLGTINFSWNG